MRRSYSIEDGVAYVSDSEGTLVEALARSCARDVSRRGALNLHFTIPGFPLKGIGFKVPKVEELMRNSGTKIVDALFPDYAAISASIPDGHSGRTSQSLEFTLY